MATRVHPIDWREEFAKLKPFLNGNGGVVRIRYDGERCAPAAFIETLKSEYELAHATGVWRSIRIDHDVYSVRYLSGIRTEFRRKMGLKLEHAEGPAGGSPSLSVGSDIQAGRDVDVQIGNVTQSIYYGQESPDRLSDARDRWVGELCDQLATFLKTGHMMVVVTHGSHRDQSEFWRYLWEDGLEKLTGSGLSLVHMLDVSDKTTQLHDQAPAPMLEIDLPTALTPTTRDHAVEDLSQIVRAKFPSMPANEARRIAETLVYTHMDDIPRLHRKSAAYLLMLAPTFG